MKTRDAIRSYAAIGAALVAVCLALWTHPAAAADEALSAKQEGVLRSVEQALKTAETNLMAAADAAGPEGKEVPQSRANLALSRSASARAYVDVAVKAVEGLPADHPRVKALRGRLSESKQAIDALEKRLTGESAKPKPDAPAGTKLDYKQEKLLKDADFHLREMEGAAESLAKSAGQVKAAADPDRLNYADLEQAAATIERARGRKKLVDGYLKDLPPGGAGVADVAGRTGKAAAAVDDAEKVIGPARERVRKLLDPAGYPALDEDVKRLRGLAQMVGDTRLFEGNPERAADVVKQAPAAREELARVLKAYAPLLAHEADAGKPVKAAADHLAKQLKAFDAAAAEKKKALPDQIRADLDKANQMAEQAVKEQKPLFFRGGIPDLLKRAEGKVAIFNALDPEAAKALQTALTDAGKQMKERQASLRQLIIAETPLPPDRYAGADKAALAEKAVAAWKAQQPDARVLAVRIPSDQWERETSWRRQNTTWYKFDRSALQVQVLVRHDDKLAVIRPVSLYADHLKNDSVTASPLYDVTDELTPELFLLTEKIK